MLIAGEEIPLWIIITFGMGALLAIVFVFSWVIGMILMIRFRVILKRKANINDFTLTTIFDSWQRSIEGRKQDPHNDGGKILLCVFSAFSTKEFNEHFAEINHFTEVQKTRNKQLDSAYYAYRRAFRVSGALFVLFIWDIIVTFIVGMILTQ